MRFSYAVTACLQTNDVVSSRKSGGLTFCQCLTTGESGGENAKILHVRPFDPEASCESPCLIDQSSIPRTSSSWGRPRWHNSQRARGKVVAKEVSSLKSRKQTHVSKFG